MEISLVGNIGMGGGGSLVSGGGGQGGCGLLEIGEPLVSTLRHFGFCGSNGGSRMTTATKRPRCHRRRCVATESAAPSLPLFHAACKRATNGNFSLALLSCP